MMLIVDKNEQDTAPDIVQSLKNRFTQVIVANLPHREFGGISVTAGDINIPLDDGNVLAIERKTPTDFLNSISNGHIFHQIETMHAHAKFVSLIITGKLSYSPEDDTVIADRRTTEWSGVSVRAALREIQVSNCFVEFCPVGEYPAMIEEVYKTCLSIISGKRGGNIKNRIVTFPPIDRRVEFIAQLPGVGLESATSLVGFAGMMEGMPEEEIVNLDGTVTTWTPGTIAQSLHWMSIMSQIDKESRPKGWTGKRILTVRKFTGLASNQYININEEVSDDEQ